METEAESKKECRTEPEAETGGVLAEHEKLPTANLAVCGGL